MRDRDGGLCLPLVAIPNRKIGHLCQGANGVEQNLQEGDSWYPNFLVEAWSQEESHMK